MNPLFGTNKSQDTRSNSISTQPQNISIKQNSTFDHEGKKDYEITTIATPQVN